MCFKRILKYDFESKRVQILINHSFNKEITQETVEVPLVSEIKEKQITKSSESEFDVKFKELWNLYPISNGKGRYLRQNTSVIKNKLKRFFNENKEITWDLVFAATKEYLNRTSEDDYKFTQNLEYFIEKNKSSVLLLICEEIRKNDDQDTAPLWMQSFY